MTVSGPRTQRINLRATTYELKVLRQASAVAGTTLTAFILTTAVRAAQALLADSNASD